MNIFEFLFIAFVWYVIGLSTLIVVVWKDYNTIVLNKSLVFLTALFGPILPVFFIWDKIEIYRKNKKK